MTSTIWLLVLAAALVVLAGVLIAAETAIGRVSRSGLEDDHRSETPRAERLAAMLDDRAKYVNALLFASTLATVSATAIVACALLQAWSSSLWAVLAAIAVMAVVSYSGLGVAARTLGRQHSESAALALAGLARGLAALLGPLPTGLILLGNAVTPGKGYRQGPFATQAELREMVDLAEAEDVIEDDERQMIHSVFELGDTVAREVMVPRTEIVFIERGKSLRQALALSLRSGCSRIPVIGENSDDIVGIVYLKDIVRRMSEHRDSENSEAVESLMRPAYFVPDSKPVDALLRDMQAARVHLAIVLDEYGGTDGLVTIEDILEEIVGEITDEYDTAAPEVADLGPGAFRVLGRMHVEDFADLIGAEIDAEDEGVDTVLGLMAKMLGRVPIPGAQVELDGWQLTAEQAAGRRNRIGTVLAQRLPESDDERPADE